MWEGLANSHLFVVVWNCQWTKRNERIIPQKSGEWSHFSVGFGSEAAGRWFAAPANRDRGGDGLQGTVCSVRTPRGGERGNSEATLPVGRLWIHEPHYSLRSISAACGYDIRMMYLLQGKKGTEPWTFWRFYPKPYGRWRHGKPVLYGAPRYFKGSASNPEKESLLNWAYSSESIVQSSQKAHLAYSSRIGDSGDFCAEVKRMFIQKSWSMRLHSILEAVCQRQKPKLRCNSALT